MPPPPSDTRVRALLDNQSAFLAFLERRVGGRDVAEDLLQEALARAVQRISTLRDGEAAVAWFYQALRNAVVDHHRRRGASARAVEALARELGEGEASPSPEVHSAVCQCVSRLVTQLKPEYAAALTGIEVEGTSVKDFAAQQGITANNAAVRVHRARAALEREVRSTCGRCAENGCQDCTCGSAG
jgi:RNA polymerase sigma-70 factor (ECF subfamily)